MSYCRFSSDNYACDVYVYESCYGGFDVHVAAYRYVGDIPKLPKYSPETAKEYYRAADEQVRILENLEKENIGGKYDGEKFNCETLGHLLICLEDIENAGYNVPSWVIDDIRNEIEESEITP